MISPRDGAEHWRPNEPSPVNFDRAAYQKRIDDIVGTKDGRPIIKLAWGPEEFRWWPHRMGQEPPGYVFPIFHAYTDTDGNLIAAPRWVLLDRLESPQFAPTPQYWEQRRYDYHDGVLWDMTGPCPSEKYIELRCHAYHDGICCTCLGDTCECGVEYAHCWGRYAEPNERLLEWIRKTAWEARRDKDVKPSADVRYLESTESQSDLRSRILNEQAAAKEYERKYNEYLLSHWNRKPHSVSKATSGLYLAN